MIREKKIGPIAVQDIWFDTESFLESKRKVVCLHSNEELGKSFYDEVFTGQTLLLDISGDLEDVMLKFSPKSCRYPIRKAIKDGIVVIKANTNEQVKQYVEFENSFCEGKGIPKVSLEEMQKLDVFYAVSATNEYLGGCAFVVSDKESIVRYKYGATLHKMNANEVILWKAIEFYHNKGIMQFDFGGVIPTQDEASYYYRHYYFKKKFGGDLINSYNYFKFAGVYRILYCFWNKFVGIRFNGDLNEALNWLNGHGLVR